MTAFLLLCYICIALAFAVTRTRYALRHGRAVTGASPNINDRYALWYGFAWGAAWPVLLLVAVIAFVAGLLK